MLLPHLLPQRLEAGCDEAGRGCLAGNLIAAAVILKPAHQLKGLELLNDSKQLTAIQRKKLFPVIHENAISISVASASVAEIEEMNILKATFLAMHRAIKTLHIKPQYLLIDGNRFTPYPDIPHTTVIKGDSIYMSIAAASVIAKVIRDLTMEEMHYKYPVYHLNENKGYPTKAHRDAIREHGPSPIHRKTFRLLPNE